MLSSTRSPTGMSETSRSRVLRGFARSGLIVTWAVFWFNTALFPCCEVIAAVSGGHAANETLGGHAANGSESAPTTPSQHHHDAEQSEPVDHSPEPPCGDTLTSGPALVGGHEVLAPDRSSHKWFPVEAYVATTLVAVNDSVALALTRAVPPPPPSPLFYQRTQRLLI